MAASRHHAEKVVILARTGADAANIARVLNKAAIRTVIAGNTAEAAQKVDAGFGALLLTEESVAGDLQAALTDAIARQPLWSDIPLVVITSAHSIHWWAVSSTDWLGARSNVSLIARPLQGAILVAAVKAVLRARRRQFQVRDLLRERETLLGSLEQRVQERTAKLQELVAELESFSYSVSHDLRAPLRIMASYAEIVLQEFGPSLVPEVRHYVERIARSAARMDALTQDVLAYTRLARGEISLEPVDLRATLDETIQQYPHLSAVREVIQTREPLAAVMAHRPSLVQLLSNLLGNAVKFARPGVPLRIEIATRARGGRVRISVRDNGVGIAADHQAKIFRIFERVAGQDVPGTGIGLAIVKKAAERMGGTVGVVSKLGRGSEFWVELAAAHPRKPRGPRSHGSA